MVNIGNMMKQAQQLQKKMADVQEKLNINRGRRCLWRWFSKGYFNSKRRN